MFLKFYATSFQELNVFWNKILKLKFLEQFFRNVYNVFWEKGSGIFATTNFLLLPFNASKIFLFYLYLFFL